MKVKTDTKNTKLNNAGFSLIELVVVVLLAAVVALMVAGFMEASRTTYQKVDEDATLQAEAQAASSFIREIVTCSTAYEEITSVSKADLGLGDSTYLQVFKFKGFDYENPSATTPTKQYVFCLIDDELHFASYDADPTKDQMKEDFVTSGKYSLLAKCVQNVVVSVKDDSQGNGDGSLVTINLALKYRAHNYSTTLKVLARNMK